MGTGVVSVVCLRRLWIWLHIPRQPDSRYGRYFNKQHSVARYVQIFQIGWQR